MGLIGGYYGYMFEEEQNKTDHDARNVSGTVYWTLATKRFPPTDFSPTAWEKIITEWSDAGYKIGLLLRTDQSILELVYGGIALNPVQPQDQEVADLARVYGVPTGYKWVAWSGRGLRQHEILPPITITFSVRMRLAPASTGPLMIPVASRHLKGSFRDSMPGLWAIGRGK